MCPRLVESSDVLIIFLNSIILLVKRFIKKKKQNTFLTNWTTIKQCQQLLAGLNSSDYCALQQVKLWIFLVVLPYFF